MKGHVASITFYQISWHQASPVFVLLALKNATAKAYFSRL